MRILMVAPLPPPGALPIGGVESSSVALIEGLRDAGLWVDALSPLSRASDFLRSETPRGTSWWAPAPASRLHRWAVAQERVNEAISTARPDLVHLQAFSRLSTRGTPRIATIHGIVEEAAKYDSNRLRSSARRVSSARIEARARDHEPNVIAISDYIANLLPTSVRRVWRINNAVAPTYFSQQWAAPDLPTLCWAGRVEPVKDLETLLFAHQRIRASWPRARLMIAGAVPENAYGRLIRKLISEANLVDSVELLGDLPAAQLATLMARSSVVVLTSRQESAPMVVSEALAVGVPVVATDVGGVSAMLQQGGGIAVPAGSAHSVASGVRAVLSDPSRYRAQQRQVDSYQVGFVAKQTLDAYAEVSR